MEGGGRSDGGRSDFSTSVTGQRQLIARIYRRLKPQCAAAPVGPPKTSVRRRSGPHPDGAFLPGFAHPLINRLDRDQSVDSGRKPICSPEKLTYLYLGDSQNQVYLKDFHIKDSLQ